MLRMRRGGRDEGKEKVCIRDQNFGDKGVQCYLLERLQALDSYLLNYPMTLGKLFVLANSLAAVKRATIVTA